jgi:hypothetical protein
MVRPMVGFRVVRRIDPWGFVESLGNVNATLIDGTVGLILLHRSHLLRRRILEEAIRVGKVWRDYLEPMDEEATLRVMSRVSSMVGTWS